MLRTGLVLFGSCSSAVFLRVAGWATFGGPETKWICLGGLSVAFMFFSYTYLRHGLLIKNRLEAFQNPHRLTRYLSRQAQAFR